MVHFLRFNKQLERWEGLNSGGGDPVLKRSLASALVTDLPIRVQQGDVTASEARALLMRLLPDAEPNASAREARLGDTMDRVQAAAKVAEQALAQSGTAVVPIGAARPGR
jgi:polyhydroxyalkanoate synthesis regulator phasin